MFETFIKYVIKNKREVIFVILLIALSAYLRFHSLGNTLYWMFDEERDAFVVKRILVDHHFTLIGGAVPGAFYLAPGYFYISAIPYFFSHGNPMGPAVVAASLGTLSTLLLFLVTKKLFNRQTAVFASLIYTVSYLTISYNKTWWPLTFGMTISILTYYCLYQAIQKRQPKWAIPLSLISIVGAQSDPSNFSLIILTIIFWLIYKISIKNKYVFTGIFLFVASHIPLVIFDLRHDFFNTKLVLKLFTFKSGGRAVTLEDIKNSLNAWPQIFSRFIFVSFKPDFSLQIVPQTYYLDEKMRQIPQLLYYFSLFIFGWLTFSFTRVIKSKDNLGFKIVGTHLSICFLGITLYGIVYPGYSHDWFFQVLFPAFSIILGLFLSKLYKFKSLKFVVLGLLAIYLFISLSAFTHSKNTYNFGDKANAAKWAIINLKGEPFSLDSIGKSFRYGGYRYLFYLYGHEPVKSYMDPVFIDWMYPASSISKSHPDKVVVIASPDFYYDPQYALVLARYRQKALKSKQFGRIEVLIVDNKDKWVNW